MAKLSRADAMTFYKRFYAPNNAILVVTGDVTPEEVQGACRSRPTASSRPTRRSAPRDRAAGAAASRRAPRRAQGPARRQGLAASQLFRAELSHGRAGRSGSARSLDQDRGDRAPPAGSTRSSSSRSKVASSAGGGYSGSGARQRQDLALRGRRGRRRLEQGRGCASTRCSPTCAPTASPSRAGARQDSPTSPTTSTSATTRRRSPAATAGRSPSAARSQHDRGWPDAHLQGHARRRQEGRRQVSRHPPLGYRNADPGLRPRANPPQRSPQRRTAH